MYLVLSYYGANLYLAQTLGYTAGTLNSYGVNRSWTFGSKGRFFGPELTRFVLVNLLTLGVSLAALGLLERAVGDAVLTVTAMGRGYNLTRVLIKLPLVALTMTLNFILSRLWVFRS